MKRATLLLAAVAALAALLVPAPAAADPLPAECEAAEFGLCGLDLNLEGAPGSPQMLAGTHPFALTTTIALRTHEVASGRIAPVEEAKDLRISVPPGLVGDTTAVPRCPAAEFLSGEKPSCDDTTVLGLAAVDYLEPNTPTEKDPVFNLAPSPGSLLKIGFVVAGRAPVIVDFTLNPNPPYNVIATAANISQAVFVFRAKTALWGVPADPAHDALRGNDCASSTTGKSCSTAAALRPFITLPTACHGPLSFGLTADSWQHPGVFTPPLFVQTHDDSTPPNPLAIGGCAKVPFAPSITAKPTSKAASSPSGLDFSLDIDDQGLGSPTGTAASTIEKAVVTLPEGFSPNPSLAEGLGVCTQSDLARESAASAPGAGCPDASKIGSLEVESPLIDQTVKGSLYIAKPYENPFGTLLAAYLVLKSPSLGISIAQPLKIESDPFTGQLTTTAPDLPQLPFSHLRLHFREGARSPLATPPACGSYQVRAVLTPASGAPPLATGSDFQIVSGPDSSPCPKGGLPPFHPALSAGTLNNAAGRFSPFNVKLTRTDSEQELTRFSIKLPPGIAGKLAGIPFCSDAQIAQAIGRTGPHGGQEELNDPSCPAASQVGRTLAGAGVGPSLAYAPGKVYLSGPYHGAPISFVSITSGVVGPFDIGTVVVRLAIRVNPETGEVFLDSTGSDPIPHIIKGIPVHLRDIRAYTDRPEFTFNPTSCARTSTASTVLGSGLDFASGADDNPFTATSPFQAADCAALPFAPRLSLKLIGGTNRGAHPKLKAFLRMNGFGEAGIARAQVTLPRSEFIENAHFKTICTRVQFKQAGGNGEACPAGSIYGWARAKTPVLAEPLEGPVFLRSSEHQLPDLVASLRGQEIDVHLVGHVDSVKGQLRNTFETVPDAPVEWASFTFQGKKKGLFVNSANLCVGKHRADVRFTGHNGKRHDYRTALEVSCGESHRKAHRGGAERGHMRAAR